MDAKEYLLKVRIERINRNIYFITEVLKQAKGFIGYPRRYLKPHIETFLKYGNINGLKPLIEKCEEIVFLAGYSEERAYQIIKDAYERSEFHRIFNLLSVDDFFQFFDRLACENLSQLNYE